MYTQFYRNIYRFCIFCNSFGQVLEETRQFKNVYILALVYKMTILVRDQLSARTINQLGPVIGFITSSGISNMFIRDTVSQLSASSKEKYLLHGIRICDQYKSRNEYLIYILSLLALGE